MFDHQVCWSIHVRCDTRRCCSGTRSRLHMKVGSYGCCVYYPLLLHIKLKIHFNRLKSSFEARLHRYDNRSNCMSYLHHSYYTYKPLQSMSPSLIQPDGQSPHVRPPGVLVHVRLPSHLPLSVWHSFTSECEGRLAWVFRPICLGLCDSCKLKYIFASSFIV